jgi:hypothetical protein
MNNADIDPEIESINSNILMSEQHSIRLKDKKLNPLKAALSKEFVEE